jgi:catechol 2,3-dioxygenase-like lactoylglutathione lyase family enzyme
MNLTGMFHVNVNCSNYERSREFYALLGYRVMWEVPEKGSPEVSAAVGMPPYTVRGALLALEGAPNAPLIDLLEWRDPNDASPPYAHLYHLGIARICFASSDLEADVKLLKERGVRFVSEPVRLSPPGAGSSRFVCFKDPDGTILELVQNDPA